MVISGKCEVICPTSHRSSVADPEMEFASSVAATLTIKSYFLILESLAGSLYTFQFLKQMRQREMKASFAR